MRCESKLPELAKEDHPRGPVVEDANYRRVFADGSLKRVYVCLTDHSVWDCVIKGNDRTWTRRPA